MIVESKKEEKILSRREFFVGAGKLAIGATGITVVSAEVLNQLASAVVPPKAEAKKAEVKEKPKYPWPWPYKKLDLDRVGQTAYDKWFDVFCSQAVATGLFEQLREKIGEPYISFPIEALRFGMGGMLGWGLTCGSPISGALLIGLTVPKDKGERMIIDLLKWYSNTALLSFKPKVIKATIKDKDGKEREFKGDFKYPTVAGSPLCHLSVGRFMKKNCAHWDSDPRKNRCAMVAASVAVKTAEILNKWVETGDYKPVHEPQLKVQKAPLRKDVKIAAQDNCSDCHNPFKVAWRAVHTRITLGIPPGTK